MSVSAFPTSKRETRLKERRPALIPDATLLTPEEAEDVNRRRVGSRYTPSLHFQAIDIDISHMEQPVTRHKSLHNLKFQKGFEDVDFPPGQFEARHGLMKIPRSHPKHRIQTKLPSDDSEHSTCISTSRTPQKLLRIHTLTGSSHVIHGEHRK